MSCSSNQRLLKWGHEWCQSLLAALKAQDRTGKLRVVLCAISRTIQGHGEGGAELCSVAFDKVLPFILLLPWQLSCLCPAT